MIWIRVLIKTPLLLSVVFLFFVIGLLNKVLFLFFSSLRRSIAQLNTMWACACCLQIFNIKVSYELSKIPQGSLLISNHMSYTDVLVIASKIPTLFVTSLELKKTPFLGQITQIGECLYVNRLSHKDMAQEIKTLRSTLTTGHNVLVFPEASTSDGFQIKPYKSSLLKVSDQIPLRIFNYCLQYTHANGRSLIADKKSLAWTHDQSFLGHAIGLMKHKSIQARLVEVEHLSSQDFSNRKSLANHLYESTVRTYNSF